MILDGHTIGNHTYSHLDAGAVSGRTYMRDVRKNEELLCQMIGMNTRLFRPPYGRVSPATVLPLILGGRTIVLWNVDVRDYEKSADRDRQLAHKTPLRDGDIVLMHDVYPHAAAVLPAIIHQATASGLKFCALPPKNAIDCDRRDTA